VVKIKQCDQSVRDHLLSLCNLFKNNLSDNIKIYDKRFFSWGIFHNVLISIMIKFLDNKLGNETIFCDVKLNYIKTWLHEFKFKHLQIKIAFKEFILILYDKEKFL
jgi:hypothetical protein